MAKELGEVGEWVASMHWKITDACKGEAQAIANAKAEVENLKKSFQAKIKDLKETNNQI